MKLLFILLLGLGFSQTELTTRVYEIDNLQNHQTINLNEIVGFELDIGAILFYDVSCTHPSNQDCYISLTAKNPTGSMAGQSSIDIQSDGYIKTDGIVLPLRDYLEYDIDFNNCDTWNELISITIGITAEFPQEDTGYIEDGFEFCVSPGANLLSFPCDNPISVSASLPQGSENFITSIIGQGVATEYNPALGWIGSLAEFTPGSGYWFKSNESLCFEYECVEN